MQLASHSARAWRGPAGCASKSRTWSATPIPKDKEGFRKAPRLLYRAKYVFSLGAQTGADRASASSRPTGRAPGLSGAAFLSTAPSLPGAPLPRPTSGLCGWPILPGRALLAMAWQKPSACSTSGTAGERRMPRPLAIALHRAQHPSSPCWVC